MNLFSVEYFVQFEGFDTALNMEHKRNKMPRIGFFKCELEVNQLSYFTHVC